MPLRVTPNAKWIFLVNLKAWDISRWEKIATTAVKSSLRELWCIAMNLESCKSQKRKKDENLLQPKTRHFSRDSLVSTKSSKLKVFFPSTSGSDDMDLVWTCTHIDAKDSFYGSWFTEPVKRVMFVSLSLLDIKVQNYLKKLCTSLNAHGNIFKSICMSEW